MLGSYLKKRLEKRNKEIKHSNKKALSENKKKLFIILLVFLIMAGLIFAMFRFGIGGITGAAIFGTKPTAQVTPENCTDGIDNDGDGLIDCQDPQCSFQDVCQAQQPEPEPEPEPEPQQPSELPQPIQGGSSGGGGPRIIIKQEQAQENLTQAQQPESPSVCTPQRAVLDSKTEKIINCDGTTSLTFSSKKKYFYDGDWKRLGNNIYSSSKIDGFVAKNELFKTYFYRDPSVNLTLSFETNDKGVSMDYRLLGASSTTGIPDKNKITYPNIFNDVDLQYYVLDNTLKESFIIKSNSLSELSFELFIDQASLDHDKDGNIYVYDINTNETLWYITKPFLVDAAGNYNYNVDYSLNNNIITVKLDSGYMANAKYPVVLDPSSVINATPEPEGSVTINGAVNVPSQIHAGFNTINNNSELKSKVFGIKEEFSFKTATISLPITEPVTYIMYCPNFNYDTFSCPEWVKRTDIPFTQNQTHVTFNVTHFSGWGAGSSVNYNASSTVITGGGDTLSSANYVTDAMIGVLSGDSSSSNYKTSLGFFYNFAFNSFPTMNAPTFNPAIPNTSSSIQCLATPTDAENTTLDVEYFWYNGTQLVLSGNNTGLENGTQAVISTLDSSYTNTGETWNCTIRAFDGEDYSNFVSSAVQIANAQPYISAPTFNPPAANTSTNIQCRATPNDLENTTLTVEYYWYNGSTLILSGNKTGVTAGQDTVISTLGSGNTSYGETWNCTVRAYDGSDYGVFESSTIYINNSLPQISKPSFSPSTAYTTSDIDCKATPSDTETSSLTVEYYWYNGSTLMLSGNKTGLASGVNSVITTLGRGNTTKGETWKCKVRSNDGITSSYFMENTITIQNSVPTMTAPVFNDTNLYEPDDVSASSTIEDNDTDTSTVYFKWYVDGINIYNETITGVSTGSTLVSNLTNDNYVCNQTLQVKVYANDAEEDGPISSSEVMTVNCGFRIYDLDSTYEIGKNSSFNIDPRLQPQADDDWYEVRDSSTGRKYGKIRINFTKLNANLNMSGVIKAGSDVLHEKAFFHVNTSRPDVAAAIDAPKVLYIPYSGTPQNEIYICPGAASLSEVTPTCSGKVKILAGQTVQGMSFTTVNEGGQDYYLVTGITGTGGGEGSHPVIEHVSLEPSSGTTSTVFTWRANYTDLENDLASVVKVEINNTNYTMVEEDSGDTNVMDGKIYVFAGTFSEGLYQYKYHAFDEASVYNASATFTGPNVTLGTSVDKGGPGGVSGADTSEQFNRPSLNETQSGTKIAKGGAVAEINISTEASTEKWQAYVGRVSAQLRLGSGTDILYDFGTAKSDQIKTVFSTADTGFNFAKLTAAGASDPDTVFGWSSTDADSSSNVFDDSNATIAHLNNVPAANLTAHTSSGELDTGLYKVGVFKDDGAIAQGSFESLAYGVPVVLNQRDYTNTTIIDYELIVPVNSSGIGQTQTYYFYLDVE